MSNMTNMQSTSCMSPRSVLLLCQYSISTASCCFITGMLPVFRPSRPQPQQQEPVVLCDVHACTPQSNMTRLVIQHHDLCCYVLSCLLQLA